MINILSGYHEGSQAITVVSRSGPGGLNKGAVVCPTATANTVAKATNVTNYGLDAEWIFEDTTTQTSGKYSVVYGTFEAETDQYSGTPAIGSFLKYGAVATAGKLVSSIMPNDNHVTCAKVIDSYNLPINPTMLSGVGGVAVPVLRFKTLSPFRHAPYAPSGLTLDPAFGIIGSSVTITGTNLAGATSVKFNGVTATILTNNNTTITTTVPTGATTGNVEVDTGDGVAVSTAVFTVGAVPTITLVAPLTGIVTTAVTITGTNLADATVLFNETEATLDTNTATEITTTVPAGATTGVIHITTAYGTVDSASFEVTT